MAVRYGVSPIAWVNDDLPSLGAGTPVARILREARAIGYDGVELGGAFPSDAASLRALLERFGLALAGGWFSGRLLEHGLAAEIVAVAPRIALLKALGCPIFVYAETTGTVHTAPGTPLSHRPRLAAGERRSLYEGLDAVADHMAERGLIMAYHVHLGTVIEDADDLAGLVAGTNERVGFVFDTGHAALAGIEPARSIRELGRRIVHFHAKDVRRPAFAKLKAADGSFLAGVMAGMFTVPGDGELDWDAVAASLAAIGYAGWVVVEAEQDPAKAEPARYARLGLSTLRAALDRRLPAEAGAGAA